MLKFSLHDVFNSLFVSEVLLYAFLRKKTRQKVGAKK